MQTSVIARCLMLAGLSCAASVAQARQLEVLASSRLEPAPRTGSVHDAEWRLDARTRDAPVE